MATASGRLISCAPKFKKKGYTTNDESNQVESLVGSCDLWEQMSEQPYLRRSENRLLKSPVEHLAHPAPWRHRKDTFHYAKAEFGLSVSAKAQGSSSLNASKLNIIFFQHRFTFHGRLYYTKSLVWLTFQGWPICYWWWWDTLLVWVDSSWRISRQPTGWYTVLYKIWCWV